MLLNSVAILHFPSKTPNLPFFINVIKSLSLLLLTAGKLRKFTMQYIVHHGYLFAFLMGWTNTTEIQNLSRKKADSPINSSDRQKKKKIIRKLRPVLPG